MSTRPPDSPLGALEAHDELDLRDYLGVIARRKVVLAATVVAVVVGALVASFIQTPVYRAGAELVLKSRSSESLFDPDTGAARNPERAALTEAKIIESAPVRAMVRESLGKPVPPVDTNVASNTDVVELNVEHTDAEQAAIIANEYAKAYIEFRRKQNVDDLLAAAQEVQAKIDEIQGRIDGLGDEGDEDDDAPRRLRDELIAQQALFRQQLDQLQVGAALKTGGAQVVTPATPPSSPVRPTPVRSGVLAAVVGLMLGAGLAFLFDYLDDSVRDRHDLERATGGMPVLGLVPVVTDWKQPDTPVLVAREHPQSAGAEAYRALRTSVQFLGLDRDLTSVQVTSATAAEGKTTTVANLAVLFARAGQRVVAVDCDLRRPRLHEFFGLANRIGFTTVLAGEATLAEAVVQVRSIPRLHVLPAGRVPALPSELLSSPRTDELLKVLAEQFDLVLIDSPPAVPVTDASVLASKVDGVILVASANATSRRNTHRAVELLGQGGAPMLGTVLNQAATEATYGYGYGRGYGYGYGRGRGSGPADGARHANGQADAPRRARRARAEGGEPVGSEQGQ